MKATIALDPATVEVGEATAAVRALLTRWAAIAWFAPAVDDPLPHLDRHLWLLRRHAPTLLPPGVHGALVDGDWPAFVAQVERVRACRWDWRFGVLKRLSAAHAQARGWSLQVTAAAHPGPLFLAVGQSVVWRFDGGVLDAAALPATVVAPATGYRGYALMDLIHAIQWQLAEPSCALDHNPFAPLLDVYAAGGLPLPTTPERLEVFRFVRQPLPRAVLVH